jgi:hypothetical protein
VREIAVDLNSRFEGKSHPATLFELRPLGKIGEAR